MMLVNRLLYLCCCWAKSIYCCDIAKTLEDRGALYTTIVAANASDPAPMQFMLHLQEQQLESILEIQVVRLIIYDDLSKQAVAYREVSLYFVVHQAERHILEMFSFAPRLLERCEVINDDTIAGHE